MFIIRIREDNRWKSVIFFYYDLDCNEYSRWTIADAIYELRFGCTGIEMYWL